MCGTGRTMALTALRPLAVPSWILAPSSDCEVRNQLSEDGRPTRRPQPGRSLAELELAALRAMGVLAIRTPPPRSEPLQATRGATYQQKVEADRQPAVRCASPGPDAGVMVAGAAGGASSAILGQALAPSSNGG